MSRRRRCGEATVQHGNSLLPGDTATSILLLASLNINISSFNIFAFYSEIYSVFFAGKGAHHPNCHDWPLGWANAEKGLFE
jgi:hypothetical protein